MLLDLLDIGIFCIAVLISFALHFVLLRKHILNWLDPWIILFLNQAIFLTVIIYFTWMGQMQVDHFCYCVLAWLGFVLGLWVFRRKNIQAFHAKQILDERATKVALVFFLSIFAVNSGFIFYFIGIPLFVSGSTTLGAYSELGHYFGLLYYISWGTQTVISFLAMKIWLFDGRRKWGLIALGSLVIFNLLSAGGKGAYLSILMSVNMGIYYMSRNYNFPFKLPKFFKPLLALLPFLILGSFIGAVSVGYESNVFLAFLRRMIGAAEGPYYYFVLNSHSYFHGLNLFSYHFSQILPYFGYVDREAIDLGVNLTLQSDLQMGEVGHGPNPTMYVIGHISLKYFGVVYCFVIGAFLSFLRYRLKASFLVWMYLNLNAISLVGDGTLMPLDMFYVMLLSPLLIIAISLTLKRTSYFSQKLTG